MEQLLLLARSYYAAPKHYSTFLIRTAISTRHSRAHLQLSFEVSRRHAHCLIWKYYISWWQHDVCRNRKSIAQRIDFASTVNTTTHPHSRPSRSHTFSVGRWLNAGLDWHVSIHDRDTSWVRWIWRRNLQYKDATPRLVRELSPRMRNYCKQNFIAPTRPAPYHVADVTTLTNGDQRTRAAWTKQHARRILTP